MSDFETIKEFASLKEYADHFLRKKGKAYICPSCGSGTGPKGTPAFNIKGDLFKCFSCHTGGDIFDLAGIIHRLESKSEQLQAVAQWAGMPLTIQQGRTETQGAKKEKPKPAPDYSQKRKEEAEKLREWAANIEHPEAVSYLNKRGFTVDQAKVWGIGYDPQRKRIILPYRGSEHYHIDRDATEKAAHKYEKPKADEVGKQPFENPAALDSEAFFVCEGMFDALAIEALGFPSVALGGTGWNHAADWIKAKPYEGTVIIALDNDSEEVNANTGKTKRQESQEKAQAFLESLHSSGISARISNALKAVEVKDAGEAYADRERREALKRELQKEHEQAVSEAERAAEHAYNEALKGLSVKSPIHALHNLITLADIADPVPTGFPKLDEKLNGGLRPGMTILGALSSMGKTTFMLQIADQIAASGYPVLYVTIEQSVSELTAKSASRIILQEKPKIGAKYFPVTAQEIRTKANRERWSNAQTNALYDALETYEKTIEPNLLFLEGSLQPTVEGIRQACERIRARRGKYPVVFVDYLQLLKAPSKGMTDKQAVDENVSSLRIMAKDKIPVFLVSSLNRESYSGLIEMTSFKESGAIEYSSDVLLGLQPSGMKKKLVDKKGDPLKAEARKLRGFSIIEDLKDQAERDIELLILKNRDGKIVGNKNALQFKYSAPYNLFEEK